MKAKVHIYKSKAGRGKGSWRANIVAENGKKLWATSEGYVRPRDLYQSMKSALEALQAWHEGKG